MSAEETKSKDSGQVRTETFQRNIALELLLTSLNNSLEVAERHMLENNESLEPDYPLIFVMGPLRSGTTLFMQWLATSGVVAYPTNLMSRFYKAPAIGANIQQLLTDQRYNFRNEFADIKTSFKFESENGKTNGVLAPNEFWYFWRRFLNFQELDWLPDEELFRTVDQTMLVKELIALTRIFQKPFALKAMILNYNIPFLNRLFDNALFVQLQRDYVTNAASVLQARERQLGSRDNWYSFKIPEYEELRKLDPISQAVGQVMAIDSAVSKGIATLAPSRKLVVPYEAFCEDPAKFYTQILDKLDIDIKQHPYSGPERFARSSHQGNNDLHALENAVVAYSRRP